MDLLAIAKEQFKFCDKVRAHYGWILANGIFEPCTVTMCHAGLHGCPTKPFVAVVSQIMGGEGDCGQNFNYRNHLGVDICSRFYHWLFNESPLNKVFITKDVNEAFENDFVLMDVEHPKNVVITACIMHRHIWEEIKVPKVWDDLVKAGMDPDGAFVLSHLFDVGYGPYDGLDKEKIQVAITSQNCNHNIFDGRLNNGTLTNFKNHKMVHTSGGVYSDRAGSRHAGIRCLFGNHSSQSDDDYVPGKVRGLQKTVLQALGGNIDGEEKTIHTPFAGTRNTKVYTYRDLIEAMVKAYPKICEEDAKWAAK